MVLFCFIVIVLFLFFLIFIFLTLFYFLFVVTVLLFVSCLFFVCLFFAMLHGLWGLGSQAGVQAWAPVASGLRPSCWTNKELQAPGNINQCELSQRSSSWHQDPAPPNCLQTPVLGASGQTTSKTGTQPHPSKNEMTKKYVTDEWARWKPTRPNKWRGNRQPTWKRVQSNDSKDDPKSQK